MKPIATLLAIAAILVLTGATPPATAQSPTQRLQSASLPMRSRACGLILLSDGRAKTRAGDQAGAMAELIGSFALLQDGRALEDKAAARSVSQSLLAKDSTTRAAAIAYCQQWLTSRKVQPDFDKSEKSQWEWAQAAIMTMRTEK